MTGSLWVSWKNRILGNGDAEAFDPFDPHVLKSPPDPTASYALRTRSARTGLDHIAILGIGVPDLVGDCVAIRLGNLDRVVQTSVRYPPDPSHRDMMHTSINRLNLDRYHMAAPLADIGGELTHLSLLENEAV